MERRVAGKKTLMKQMVYTSKAVQAVMVQRRQGGVEKILQQAIDDIEDDEVAKKEGEDSEGDNEGELCLETRE